MVQTESRRGRWDRLQTSQAQPSENKKWRYACRLFVTNNLKEGAMWSIDPLLSGDSLNSGRYYLTPAAYTYVVRSCNSRRGVASGVFCGSAPRLLWLDGQSPVRVGWVQWREVDRGHSVEELSWEWLHWSWGCSCGALTGGQRKLKNFHC
jgi:hypothetical protein